jgi:hypothetical protein
LLLAVVGEPLVLVVVAVVFSCRVVLVAGQEETERVRLSARQVLLLRETTEATCQRREVPRAAAAVA